MIKRLGYALCFALVLSSGSVNAQDNRASSSLNAQDIRWAPDLASARQASLEYKVPLLIHFYGDNCLPCKIVEQNVFSRSEVVETLNKYFICVQINASTDRTNRETAAEYGVHSWPTDVYLSPDGKRLDQGTCKQNAAEYLNVLHSIAVMNRDRNVMLAAEQSNAAQQVTAQVANYAPAAAAPAIGSAGAPLASSTSNPALPAAGQLAGINPHGPNFYAQGAGTGLQQLPNSMAPNAQVTSGPILNQNQPHAVTTAVQAAGNQIAAASTPHAMNNTGHLPPMQSTAQVAPALPGPTTNPLAALVASAPTVPASSAPPLPANNAWNTTSVSATQHSQMMDNPHFATNTAAPQNTTPIQNTESVQTPAPVQNSAALPETVANANSSSAVSAKIPASTVSFQPRNALSVEANTLSSAASAAPAGPQSAQPSENTSHNQPGQVALDGYCPVALKQQGAWVPGQPQFAIKHRGRIYHLSSPEAMREFLQNPDKSSPIMSGYDAMVFLNEGKLVEGSIQHGLHEQVSGSILLFSSPESKQAYQQDFDRNTQALKIVLQQAGIEL